MMLERAWLDDLKIHDIAELATIDYAIKNTTLGTGPSPVASSTPKPRQHGTVNRTRFYGPRVFALNGVCDAGSPATTEEALDQLKRRLLLDGDPIVFRFRRYGWAFDERLEVVPAGEFQAPSAGWEPLVAWGISLEAPDPRIYADLETSGIWDPTLVGRLGIRSPLHAPLHGYGVDTTYLELTAAGTIPTPPTFTIHGPATYLSSIENASTGEAIVFEGTTAGPLSATDEVIVDVDARQLTLNGDDRGDWIDARETNWFELQPGVTNLISLHGSGFSSDNTTDMAVTFRDART